MKIRDMVELSSGNLCGGDQEEWYSELSELGEEELRKVCGGGTKFGGKAGEVVLGTEEYILSDLESIESVI